MFCPYSRVGTEIGRLDLLADKFGVFQGTGSLSGTPGQRSALLRELLADLLFEQRRRTDAPGLPPLPHGRS